MGRIKKSSKKKKASGGGSAAAAKRSNSDDEWEEGITTITGEEDDDDMMDEDDEGAAGADGHVETHLLFPPAPRARVASTNEFAPPRLASLDRSRLPPPSSADPPSHSLSSPRTEDLPKRPEVWRPGVDGMDADEELEYDPTAYDCLHAWQLEWPCLSFDVMPDDLGDDRRHFPHALFAVAGTQASKAHQNNLTLMRVTQLRKTRRKEKEKTTEEVDEDSDASESESDSGAFCSIHWFPYDPVAVVNADP